MTTLETAELFSSTARRERVVDWQAPSPVAKAVAAMSGMEAMCAIRERRGYVTFALMITDILTKGSSLIVCGEDARIEHALGQRNGDGVIDLPGVMSRKKQLAPRLLPLF
jgi:manganese-dependent inorganic pyrophosphatase